MRACVLLLLLLFGGGAAAGDGAAKQPHIVFVVVDDHGFRDNGYSGSRINTPTIDQLRSGGIHLGQYYAQKVCSPTRQAIHTGRYPHRNGMQTPFCGGSPEGLNLNETLLPELLGNVGYATHAVGKWHLGFCLEGMTPTFRGYNDFMGYYSCAETYFTHEVAGALDFHLDDSPRCGANCSQPLFSAIGTYSSFLIAQRAVDLVEAHDPAVPLFLYLAFQDTHGPAEVVPAYRDRYNATIPDMTRRTLAGKLTTVDEGLANVTAALKAKGMDDNLLLVFVADNGGPINQTVGGKTDAIGANNWPLRGGKHTAYEGGVRVTGFVHGSALYRSQQRPLNRYAAEVERGVHAVPEAVSHDSADIAARGSGTGGVGGLSGSTYSGMMHAVDWLDTICEVAGCAAADLNATLARDGASQWKAITTGAPSPHDRLVLDLEKPGGKWAEYGAGAVRVGEWKLLIGDSGQFHRPGDWSPPDPWDNAMRCEPTTYNGSSPLQLFHLPSDPSERYDWVLDASFGTNATLQAVVADARDFFDAEVAVARYPQQRGHQGKPVDVGGPIKVWQPWLDLPPSPPPPPSPSPTPPPMPAPGAGHWVTLDGCFSDADCPNVHKGNLANQTLATCQAACIAALGNATASKKCTAINYDDVTQQCVLRQCAQGKKPSKPPRAGITAYEYTTNKSHRRPPH